MAQNGCLCLSDLRGLKTLGEGDAASEPIWAVSTTMYLFSVWPWRAAEVKNDN